MKRVIRLGLFGAILITVIIANLLSSAALPPAHAQDDFDRVRQQVQQWLLDTLEKPYLILVEYTYAAAVWDDSSLGCPVAGEDYTEGNYSGYRWTFTFDNFVRYEVHSGLYGDPVMLCNATNVASNVPLSLYEAPAFAVLAPEAWLSFPSNDYTEVLFGPGTGTTCDQAGMRVNVLGGVTPGVTPDDLLGDYLAGKTEVPDSREDVGTFGRSAVFEVPCGDEQRQGRVTFVVESGAGYRIEQWASPAEFENWDALYRDILSQFKTNTIAVPTATAAPVTTPAPTNTAVPLDGAPPAEVTATATLPEPSGVIVTPDTAGTPADSDAPAATPAPTAVAEAGAAAAQPGVLAALPLAHLFMGDLFVGTLDNLPGRSVTMVPDETRRFLEFAPNGRTLAFTNTTSGQLRVLDAATGRSPRKLAENVHPAFPPAWTRDSAYLVYVADTGERDGDAALLAVYRIPVSGGDAELIGGFSYRDGCEYTSSDPADAAYYQEAGPGGVDNVLAWLPGERVLLSTGCAGGLGVLMPAEQQIIALGDDLHGGALAPDGTRFLARTDDGLAVLDFNEWERRNIPLGTPAQQLAWSPGGNAVYYATATQTDSRTLDDDAGAARGEDFFGVWPVTVNVYSLTLIRLDLTTDTPAIIWQGRGRGIGRIAPAPDNSGVLFSLIPSGLALAEVFQAGGDAMAVNEAAPGPVLYWLGEGSPSARILAYAGQPVFGAPDLFAE